MKVLGHQVSSDEKAKGDFLVVVEFSEGWWLWKRIGSMAYSGFGTVWRETRTGKRAPPWMENFLSGVSWKFKRDSSG